MSPRHIPRTKTKPPTELRRAVPKLDVIFELPQKMKELALPAIQLSPVHKKTVGIASYL